MIAKWDLALGSLPFKWFASRARLVVLKFGNTVRTKGKGLPPDCPAAVGRFAA